MRARNPRVARAVSELATPRCPGCDQPPALVLDDGGQSFCGNDDCHVFTWDARMTLPELAADVGEIDLSGITRHER